MPGGRRLHRHLRHRETRWKGPGRERLVRTRSEKAGGELLPVHQVLSRREHTRNQEVGAALRTGHRVGGARRWRATLVESNADGVTGCARTCTKQGYQRMRRPIYRRTAAACDPGIEHVLHGNRRVDGVRLRGDVAHDNGHHVRPFHGVRHPGESIRGVEVAHDLVLALWRGAELIIVSVARRSTLDGCCPEDAGAEHLRTRQTWT